MAVSQSLHTPYSVQTRYSKQEDETPHTGTVISLIAQTPDSPLLPLTHYSHNPFIRQALDYLCKLSMINRHSRLLF